MNILSFVGEIFKTWLGFLSLFVLIVFLIKMVDVAQGQHDR